MKLKYQKIFILSGILSAPLKALAQATAQAPAQGVKDIVVAQIDTARSVVEMIAEFFVKYSFQVLGGIVVIGIGWWVAGYVSKLVKKLLEKKKVDVTVIKFGGGAVKLSIIAFAVTVALGKFGVEIAPLIAGVSVAGFGLSFALQGPLSNYAAGMVLIFTKPFKVGDIIEVAGVMGEVMDMKLSLTELKTVDGEMVVVPNKHIVGEIIHNFSGSKRMDINVGISYKSDVSKAIEVVANTVKEDKRISEVKKPKVGISEFADSSINIYARAWCKQDDYWDVLFDVNKAIFDGFAANGIEIPFPQRDVHLYSDNK